MYDIEYRYKFYLNAVHALKKTDGMEVPHSHTWEIQLRFGMAEGRLSAKEELEERVERILGEFQDKFLNETEAFRELSPDTEEIGRYFNRRFAVLFAQKGWRLRETEISEGVKYSYIIQNPDDQDVFWLDGHETAELKREIKSVIKRMAKS